ncbi:MULTISPECIES: FliH/SctL family protein [unclassified Tatumella]|uniref:FliH/SctL family protein n=1 Tax=unclassified Tatumella TaxID=2649542 RepID=UPI001BAF81D9|nr:MULTISPECIES: FliH/SctL family protein [unclassified Tatumella]MBS0856704.1 flagellar assembly protein FliH [Tatumella sp. JGM16]MBS0912918.1 flagellar assembly protein FliH [Tatumella sp. JGM91]
MKPTSELPENMHWRKWQPEHFELPAPVAAEPETLSAAEPDTAEVINSAPLTTSCAPAEPLPEQQRQQIWQQGYQQGFTAGETSGHQAGYLEGKLAAGQLPPPPQPAPEQQQIRQLAESFAHSLQIIDAVITSRLLQLALQIALQITGDAVKCDSQRVARQISRLLEQDPLFSGTPQLRVHPQDLPLAEKIFAEQIAARGWKLAGDTALQPGDCLLQGEEGQLNCSISDRWLALCQRAQTGAC